MAFRLTLSRSNGIVWTCGGRLGRRQIVQTLVVALVVIAIDEPPNAGFEISGQVLVFRQDAVLERLMPQFDLSPRKR